MVCRKCFLQQPDVPVVRDRSGGYPPAPETPEVPVVLFEAVVRMGWYCMILHPGTPGIFLVGHSATL